MPCWSYSIPTAHCNVGGKLRDVPGSVCFGCYADKGNYIFRNVQNSLEKRYQSLSNPQWAEAMIELIRNPGKGKYPKDPKFFRWHDSGDLQNEKHLDDICEIARRLPDVSFWLPTKEWKLVRDYFTAHAMPQNLTVRLSMPRIDQSAPEATDDDPFTYSEVTSGHPSNLAMLCPAQDQGNKCLDCRKCWDKAHRVTTYPKH